MYPKPHLSYEDQVATMVARGLECFDTEAAVALLKSVGYYRLSAYVYPFRELLHPDAQRQASPVHYRTDAIRDGVNLKHVEGLWRFDRKLRLLCLDAVETVEIGLRTKVAYVLGERDPFGHVHRGSLDSDICRAPVRRNDPGGLDAFDDWMARYAALQTKARSEDFVRHNLYKYGEPLPVWIAVEFLDMGALVRLYGLLDKRDQNRIAKEVGVSGGPLLAAWLEQINYVRNISAHHSRLWNRTLTYKTRRFNSAQVDPTLQHAAQSEPRDKAYLILAILAYLVRRLDPKANWPLTLRTHLRKFPDLPGLNVHDDMGFPEGWEDLPLWTLKEAE